MTVIKIYQAISTLILLFCIFLVIKLNDLQNQVHKLELLNRELLFQISEYKKAQVESLLIEKTISGVDYFSLYGPPLVALFFAGALLYLFFRPCGGAGPSLDNFSVTTETLASTAVSASTTSTDASVELVGEVISSSLAPRSFFLEAVNACTSADSSYLYRLSTDPTITSIQELISRALAAI